MGRLIPGNRGPSFQLGDRFVEAVSGNVDLELENRFCEFVEKRPPPVIGWRVDETLHMFLCERATSDHRCQDGADERKCFV
jgi:hypothetical protein